MLADEKTEGPSQVIVLLGLDLDSIKKWKFESRLQKIIKVIENIEFILTKKSVTLKEIQSLIGSLKFLLSSHSCWKTVLHTSN